VATTKTPSKQKTSSKKTAKTPVADAPKCMCGCGEKTRGGRFLPGHDARLKGRLQKKFRDTGLNAQEKELVNSLGWMRFMPAKEEGKEIPTSGLTVHQVAVLNLLKANSSGLSRAGISKALDGQVNLTATIGPIMLDDITQTSEKKCPTLLGMKHVKGEVEADENEKDVTIYKITASGIKALEKEAKVVA
jgi:hypothetical protein